MSTIQIGKAIKYILSNDQYISGKVNDNIWPLVADEKTPFPFIIYKRTSSSDSYTKDSKYQDTCYIDVTVIAEDYNTSVDLAEHIETVLTSIKNKEVLDYFIININKYSTDEIYYEGVYIQNIKFIIKTQI